MSPTKLFDLVSKRVLTPDEAAKISMALREEEKRERWGLFYHIFRILGF